MVPWMAYCRAVHLDPWSTTEWTVKQYLKKDQQSKWEKTLPKPGEKAATAADASGGAAGGGGAAAATPRSPPAPPPPPGGAGAAGDTGKEEEV